MGFNLAEINEAIAASIPDRECIVFGRRRFTWRDFNQRTRRLASYLKRRRLGLHRQRQELRNFESGQDHLGIYLFNGNEYLEAMIGAFKARVAPFNVNYRYVEDELVYLLDDADCRALLFHSRFAPIVEAVRGRLPRLEVLIQVADGSGNELLPGAVDYEAMLAAAEPEPPAELSGDDLYILYTGGTTGMPKGVLWRQEDIFFAALGGQPLAGPRFESVESIAAAAVTGTMRALPAPPFMHGASHWMALTCMHQGGTVVIQEKPEHLDPDDIWSTIEREKVVFLTIVGDAFGRPLLDQLDKKQYDLGHFRTILSGGAILTPALKQAFLDRIPHLMIIDGFGASETGGQGAQIAMKGGTVSSGAFRMNPESCVLKEDLSGILAPGSDEVGWLARTGHVPLGYYKDADKTARTFPVIHGTRHAVPGDHATVAADGTIHVLGRGSVCINSGGEKIYPEEVEKALKHHPAVYDAVVVGTPHPRFGEQVTALVLPRAGQKPDPEALREQCAEHLARYKLPRQILLVDAIVRSPSGKADYRWARRTALELLGTAEALAGPV